ncbi:MAG: hypothetical protein M3N48_12825 [Verrucomicrobiota bacterium]|nr:hypothetical protein [Verrucomicrobiota bacterium]
MSKQENPSDYENSLARVTSSVINQWLDSLDKAQGVGKPCMNVERTFIDPT